MNKTNEKCENSEIPDDEYETITCEHSGIEFKSKIKPEETGEHICEHSGAVIPAKD